MNTRLVLWIIGGLTLLSTVLRIIGLNNELWYDEILTLLEYVRKPLPEIVSQYSRNNHLLNSVLAHVSVNVFGEYPWTLRLPAVVFGVACIPALYVLGTVVTSRLEALLAAGLLGVSYHHIWFSQNARGYTALAFWTLISTFFLLRGLRDNKLSWHIAYGCAAALGLYTHLTMGFVLVAQLLGSMSSIVATQANDVRIRVRRTAIGFTLAGIISLLFYAPVLMQIHLAWDRTSSDIQVKTATFSWAFWETLHSFGTGGGMWGALLGLLLLAAGFWSYLKESRLVFSLMILPGLLTMLGILILHSPIRPRFFFMLIGFGFLMVVRGATLAGGWVSHNWKSGTWQHLDPSIIGTALIGVMMLANVSSFGFLYQYPKQDYEGALRFVEATRAIEDAVITAGRVVMPYRDYYDRTWQGVESRDELETIRSSHGRVWMLYSFPEYMEPTLANSIRDECPPIRVFQGTLGGGDVVVCALQLKNVSKTDS
jgi:uncharacterized membrane protein